MFYHAIEATSLPELIEKVSAFVIAGGVTEIVESNLQVVSYYQKAILNLDTPNIAVADRVIRKETFLLYVQSFWYWV